MLSLSNSLLRAIPVRQAVIGLLLCRPGGLLAQPPGYFATPISGSQDLSGTERDESRAEILRKLNLHTLTRGTSARSTRRESRKTLPLDQLSPENRDRTLAIIESTSLFRRLPVIQVQTDHDVYQFFASRPEVAVALWRVMNISRFRMTATSPDIYEADTGDGSTGLSEVLYRTNNECLVICDGVYKSPFLLTPVESHALVHLLARFHRDDTGLESVTHELSVFVSFPSHTIRGAAKLLSPLTHMIMDRNFVEVSVFVHLMSAAMERQPGWVENLGLQLEGVPESRREEFLRLCASTWVAARRRELSQDPGGGVVTLDRVMAPLTRMSQIPVPGSLLQSPPPVPPAPAPPASGVGPGSLRIRDSVGSSPIPVRAAGLPATQTLED